VCLRGGNAFASFAALRAGCATVASVSCCGAELWRSPARKVAWERMTGAPPRCANLCASSKGVILRARSTQRKCSRRRGVRCSRDRQSAWSRRSLVPAAARRRSDRIAMLLLRRICRFLALTGGSMMSAPTSARGGKAEMLRKAPIRHS
jgi:hypothetical protein